MIRQGELLRGLVLCVVLAFPTGLGLTQATAQTITLNAGSPSHNVVAGAPVPTDGFVAMRFNGNKPATDLDFGAVGNYTVNANGTLSQATRLFSNAPAATAVQSFAMNFDREGATTAGAGNGPFDWEAIFGANIPAGDQSNFQVAWTALFSPDVNGDFTFRSHDLNFTGTGVDDEASIFVDANQNGSFEPGEGFQNGNADAVTLGLSAGQQYRIAIGYREGGGDEEVSYTIQGSAGAFTSLTGINPGAAAQSGLFTIDATPPGGFTDLIVDGTGRTLTTDAAIPAITIQTLTMNDAGGGSAGPSALDISPGGLSVPVEFTVSAALNGTTNTINANNMANVTLNNVTAVGDLVVGGNGVVNLPTANVFNSNAVVVGDGSDTPTLSVGNGSALGGASGVTVNNGGSLRIGGVNMSIAQDLIINGGGNGKSDGALHSDGNNLDYNGAITLGSNAIIRKDGGGDLEIRGGIDTAGNQLRFETVDTTRVLGGGSAISGGGSVLKEDSGTLEFHNNNTYSGTTTINNGVIDIRSDNGLGTTAGATNIDGDATLRLRGNINSAEPITLNGTSGSGNGEGSQGRIRNDADNNTLSGPIAWNNNSRVTVDNGTTLTLSGAISGGGTINKHDNGRLEITNSGNTFTGDVNIRGTVAFQNPGSMGSAGTINVPSTATLELSNVGTVAASVNIAGDGQGGVGAIHHVAGTANFTGPLSITGTTITSAAGASTTFSGPVSLAGTTDLTFNADGEMTVSQAFGNGNVPFAVSALQASRFTGAQGVDALDWSAAGAYTTQGDGRITQTSGLLSGVPAQTGTQFGQLNYNQDWDTLFGPAVSGDENNFQVVWMGEFVPDATGTFTFRTHGANGSGSPDDDGSVYVDFNQDGIFQASEGGQSGTSVSAAGAVTAGQSYTVAIGFDENSGGDNFSATFEGTAGAFTSETIINPTDPAQAGLFQVTLDPDNDIVKNGAGILRFDGDSNYNGTTDVNAGILIVNGDTSGQGSYNIASGATLGGTGAIGLLPGETVNVSGSPGTVSPGDAGPGYTPPPGGDATFSFGTDAATVGTLSFNAATPADTALNLDGILQLDIVDPVTADMIVAVQGIIDVDQSTAMLNINGETNFSNIDFAALGFDSQVDDLVLIAAADGLNGEFANVPLTSGQFEFDDASGDSYLLIQDEFSLLLSAANVPEPTSLAMWSLLGLLLAGFGYRRVRYNRASA